MFSQFFARIANGYMANHNGNPAFFVSALSPTPEITMPIDDEPEITFCEVHEIVVPHLGHVPIVKGDFTAMPKKIQQFIAFYVSDLLTSPTVPFM